MSQSHWGQSAEEVDVLRYLKANKKALAAKEESAAAAAEAAKLAKTQKYISWSHAKLEF